MYAIIETGGKQYRVEKGDVIDVELLDKQENNIEFSNVLFINNGSDIKLGNPYLNKSVVKAELLQEVKGPKVISFKYKMRKGYRRKVGHRQRYLRVKITDIVG
ncbi:MAG: 50S ribosomal protein L21 [Chlamydiae bacterium]|nr:50S ribosomal protein L21 [Chlamydiota bacterium]